VIKLTTNKKIFLLALISFLLLPTVFGIQVNMSDVIWAKEIYSSTQKASDAASSESIEVAQTVARSFQQNSTRTIQGGHQMLPLSSASNSASFSRHMMCKDYEGYWDGKALRYNPIDPTTIFKSSDTKAVCLTTVSINETIEFRWYYRSNSSKTWIYTDYNWSDSVSSLGEYDYASWLLIAEHWLYYPRAYKVDVYLDGSFSFSEFFEITNGGLNSPRTCENVDVNGHPVNMKSRFTIDVDTKAYHSLRFDNIAYFNEELGCCHNFTTVWIQPNGSTYKTYSGNFTDYKDTNVTGNYWKDRFAYDYISINSSTPVGNWKVETYLDSYYFNNAWMRYGPIATTPFIVGDKPVADWTFLVYLDADIDKSGTEECAIEIFSKLASVDFSSWVNVVVQMDRIPGHDSGHGDWTDCKRFNVTKDMTPTPENAVKNLSEVNMGDPDTLKDFVNWTIQYYPANYYFLVLWDHGAGCMGLCFDNSTSPLIDFLSLPELSQALSGLPAIMDVVLIDACSMGMTEIAYQIKDCANVLVGPQGIGYAPAPYDDYLSTLTSNPSISPSAFARDVVTDYMEWCIDAPSDNVPNATMSATDLTKITSLTAAIDEFALKLKEREAPYHEQISLARNLTVGYQGPYADQTGNYIDLYHFAQLTHQYVIDKEIRNTADQVMTALSAGNTIIVEADKAHPNSHGLSIFFPDENEKYENFGSMYEETTFAQDTTWKEFVKHHLDIQISGHILTIQTPYPDITIKVDEESYTTDTEGKLRLFVLTDSYTVNVPTLVLTEPGSRGIFTKWNDSDTSNPKTLLVNTKLTLETEYETQYRLIMDTNFGTTEPSVGEYWYKVDSTLGINATASNATSGERYVWLGWIGTGTGSYNSTDKPASITMNGPINETADWRHEYYLNVTSLYSSSTPTSDWFEAGISITASVTSPVSGPVGTQYICTGWTGTGSVSMSGTNTSVTFTMNEPSSITWNWKTQYLLLQVILGLVGIVLTVALVRTAWVRSRRRRIKAPAEPEAIEVLLGRIDTGYGDLDKLLFGGIPENYAVILTSPSCDERDLLIKKFLETGAKKGEVTFYVTIDPGEIRSPAEEFQSNFYLFICNPQADKIIKSLPNIFKIKGVENLTEISIALTKAFRRLDTSITGPKRACIEIISDVLLQHHAVQTRRWLTDLIPELKSRGFTILAVMNPQMHPSEEVHAILDLFEGEINIYEKETEKGLEKFLKINKMLNQRYLENELPLKKEKMET
jgi:KaiC/GvpD/RAD55 family RecA-like ATPase